MQGLKITGWCSCPHLHPSFSSSWPVCDPAVLAFFLSVPCLRALSIWHGSCPSLCDQTNSTQPFRPFLKCKIFIRKLGHCPHASSYQAHFTLSLALIIPQHLGKPVFLLCCEQQHPSQGVHDPSSCTFSVGATRCLSSGCMIVSALSLPHADDLMHGHFLPSPVSEG